VLLVALDHAGLRFLQGGYVGVDVFFVLSGFLITSLLLTQAAKRGAISLADFYRRRARRILPAAALTLVVTDLVAWQLLNFVRARQAVSDSVWASFFAANVHFAHDKSDYFAQGRPPSPVEHFWTLSVEEQFYLVWPLLLSLVLFGFMLARGRMNVSEAGIRRSLMFITVAGAASLGWSIYATAATPLSAYFSTITRAWELALGAGLAIAAPRLLSLRPFLQTAAGWIGLACIGAAAVAFSASTAFPGYAALLPTIGTALVIGAGIGSSTPRLGVARALALAPLRYIGDRSYAFYLWHWPVLVIAAEYVGHGLSPAENLLLLSGAFVLSIVSYAAFENPIRRMQMRPRASLLLWPASAGAVLAFAFVILGSLGNTSARIEAASAAVRPTSFAAAPAVVHRSKVLPAVASAVRAADRGSRLPWPLTPPVDKLESDRYPFPPKGCTADLGQTSGKLCRLGDLRAGKTLVVIGDSHAMMWMPTILRMAKRDRWLVIPLLRSRCVPGRWVGGNYPPCAAWYRWALRQSKSLRPLVTLITAKWSNTRARVVLPGIKHAIRATRRWSESVIVVGDPPGLPAMPVDCLLARGANMKTCSPRARAVDLQTDRAIRRAATRRHAGFVDVRGWFCGRSARTRRLLCPMVVNRTITRTDRDHISRTYGLELAHTFRRAFRLALFA
jgi:peptidoglycan/LPS O-acetylase OafA/YrhL